MAATIEVAITDEREHSLSRAFLCFTQAAASLEHSYQQLESEVVRLRRELEERNAELSRSLEENRCMRNALHQVLERLPCGVLVARHGGCLSLVNPAARQLLQCDELGSLEQLSPSLRAWLEHARAREGDWELELSSPPSRWLTARHAWLRQGDWESIFILQDVTEQKRHQQDRERLEKQKALADMVAMLAHEIRNPLGSLELFAGLLAETPLAPEPQVWVEHLQAGLRMLAATVNNVLHFHNSPRPQPALTDLGELLGWVGEFLRPLAAQSQVELTLENRLAGVQVLADRHRLEQVLLNLAINALRVLPSGGRLVFSGRLQQNPRLARIEVADNGPGIPPEIVERIFEAGYTTRPGSPGLGLTVCRTIVQQHGGTISARNHFPRGASFLVSLPLGAES